MKYMLYILIITLSCTQTFAREKLIKDIDFDGLNDIVYIDIRKSVIVCQLSTQQFHTIESKPVAINEHTYISESKNGFSFSYPEMRWGFSAQFRYDKNKKRIQLIGMKRYSFGNAAGDDSGETSVNLLTNNYIGNWNYYDHLANNEEGELVPIPRIKTKMNFDKIYLDNFGERIAEDYGIRCAALIDKYRSDLIKKRKNKQ